MPRALITGINGQDGSLLTELLLDRGYDVVGIVRPGSTPSDDETTARAAIRELDLLDEAAVTRAVSDAEPDELYHLASASFVPASWDDPAATMRFATVAAATLLEAVRRSDRTIRFCNASSSEVFDAGAETPFTELTPIAPRTPYGIGKAAAQLLTRGYRERYGLHASSAILFNHESPLRPAWFLPRKVSLGVAAIARGEQHELVLGDLDAARDWGYAGDYVRAMWAMLQQGGPGDYVVATGEAHTVRELVATAFACAGLDYRDFVRSDPSLVRGGSDRRVVVGDATKARAELGWAPEVDFAELVRLLVDADLQPVA